MPKMYIKVKDSKTKKEYFMGWSTIIDEPNTSIWDAKTFNENVRLSDEEQTSLDKIRCSNPHYTVAELIDMSPEFNTQKQLIQYCIENVQDVFNY